MFIIPKAGLKVTDPFNGDYLPETGRKVTYNSYWYRRLKEKSVIVRSEAVSAAEPVPEATAEPEPEPVKSKAKKSKK
jgi:hypothetical protein